MVGLLKTTKPCIEHDSRRSGCKFVRFEDFVNTTKDFEALRVMSEVCKQNFRKQDMALYHDEPDRRKLQKHEQSKDIRFHSFSLPDRSQDLANTIPPKRQRIVSVARHRFEPFSSKDNLVNRRSVGRFSGPHSTASNYEIAKQNKCLNQYGNLNQDHAELCSSCSNIIYRSCNRCCHFVNGDDSIVSRSSRPEIANEQGMSSVCREDCSLHIPCNVNVKQAETRGQPIRQHSSPYEKGNHGPEDKSSWDSYRPKNVINSALCGSAAIREESPRLVKNADLGDELESGLAGASAKSIVNSSSGATCNRTKIRNQTASSSANNDWTRGELTTLKVFVADEGTGSEKLAPKQLFMPPSERLKCLKFSPGQYFDVVFEEIPKGELNRLIISEVNGKENHAMAGFESVNTKENFVKELRSIFSRMPSLEEERLKERDLFEMILLAKAYFDKYEHELEEKNRKDCQLLEHIKANDEKSKSSSDIASVMEHTPLEVNSNASNGDRHEGSCYQFIGFQPINDVGEDDTVDNSEKTVADLKSVGSTDSNSVSGSVLLGSCSKEKSCETRPPSELCSFTDGNKLLEIHTVQCSDATLKKDSKYGKEQEMVVKTAKRRQCLLKERQFSSNEVRGKRGASNGGSKSVTPALKVCASDEKEIANTCTNKYSVSMDEKACKRRKHERGEEGQIRHCGVEDDEYQNGTGMECEKVKHGKFY